MCRLGRQVALGTGKKVHRCWQNKQHSEHLISTKAALVLISKLRVNDLPVGKLSGQHFGLSGVVAAASADTSETFLLIRSDSMSILSVSSLCKIDEDIHKFPLGIGRSHSSVPIRGAKPTELTGRGRVSFDIIFNYANIDHFNILVSMPIPVHRFFSTKRSSLNKNKNDLASIQRPIEWCRGGLAVNTNNSWRPDI